MGNFPDGVFFEKVLGAAWRGGVPARICGAAIDSRKISPGEIFVALKTEKRDGHDFLEAARARGAAGALVSRFVPASPLPQLVVPDAARALREIAAAHRRERCGNVRVFGVTGSVGKTSTKDLLARVLSEEGATLATEKNLNNTLGVPLTLLKIDPAAHRFAVVEAGVSVPGEMEILAAMIRPDVAVVTNIFPAHLEGFGTLENIAREKSALCRAVPPSGKSVFPAELLRYESFRALGAGAVPVQVAPRELDDGFAFGGFALKNVSRGFAENAALVAAAAADCVPEEKIRRAFAAHRPSAFRGETRERAGGGKIFVDCYNASPASMLDSARAFAKRFPAERAGTPRLFVLGGMGELGAASAALHFEVGEKLPLDAATDTLALFGGDAAQIGEGAVARGFPRVRVRVFSDIGALRDFAAAFRGNAMFKGSRAFALERAVPED